MHAVRVSVLGQVSKLCRLENTTEHTAIPTSYSQFEITIPSPWNNGKTLKITSIKPVSCLCRLTNVVRFED